MPQSIAVLPFVDMSEEKDQEYFADGMAEELRGVLAKVPKLTVIGRTSAFSFKGRNEDVRVIGEKLGATHVVEGSVRRSGDHIRISAQLIDARTGAQAWAGTYDRELGDVLVLQAEIASGIARSLQLAVGADVVRDTRPLRSAEAYTFFLRGRAALDLGGASVTEAKTYFEQALALDPDFVRAQEALALGLLNELENGQVLPATGWPLAVKAARDTLRRDPGSALAHVILGLERAEYAFDWGGARSELNQALALQPRDPYALYVSSWLAADLGDIDTSARLLDAALAIDPLNPEALQTSGFLRYDAGDLDGAERAFRASLQISPTFGFSHRSLGLVLLMRGQPEAALKEMQAEPGGTNMGLALVYHALGRKADSDAALARHVADAERASISTFVSAARVHAYRNEPNEAFAMLDRAFERRDHNLLSIVVDPIFAPLHRDPRYRALLRKMNLDDATRAAASRAPPAPPRP
jgi:TolB-like protein